MPTMSQAKLARSSSFGRAPTRSHSTNPITHLVEAILPPDPREATIQKQADEIASLRAQLAQKEMHLIECTKECERKEVQVQGYAKEHEALVQQYKALEHDHNALLRNQQTTQHDLQKAMELVKELAPPMLVAAGKANPGICINWARSSQATMLNKVVKECTVSIGAPGSLLYPYEPGKQYAVVLLFDYPATSRVEETLAQAIQASKAAATTAFAFVALRWGSPDAAPRMRVTECETIELFWDKRADDSTHLVDHPRNAESLRRLKQLIAPVLPEAETNPIYKTLQGICNRIPWR